MYYRNILTALTLSVALTGAAPATRYVVESLLMNYVRLTFSLDLSGNATTLSSSHMVLRKSGE